MNGGPADRLSASIDRRGLDQGIALALTCILLIAAAVIWIPGPRSEVATVAARGTPAATERADGVVAQISDAARALEERPLFHMTRRPPQQAQPAPVPEVTISLAGVLDGDGQRIALLRLSNSPELIRATAGERVGRWRVAEIQPQSVTLREEDGSERSLAIGR